MQRTTNYNFKKPDYTDFADIQDINDNMDAIDAELAAPTGDLANATIKSSTASTASYPVPAANDTMKVMLGKIIKFCADIVKTFTGATSTKAGAKGLVPAPTANQHTRFLRADGTWREPVNGAGTTTAGDVLDARMGKTLNDKINTLNDSFADKTTRRYDAESLATVYENVDVEKFRAFSASSVMTSKLTNGDVSAEGYGFAIATLGGIDFMLMVTFNGYLYAGRIVTGGNLVNVRKVQLTLLTV